ncbi:MAG: hypothetical protein HZY76_07895 [Anaerolineae bacterium]|nr:MAG: hypothetical protein HZY76_07895 [Anaerolineae bacterium]
MQTARGRYFSPAPFTQPGGSSPVHSGGYHKKSSLACLGHGCSRAPGPFVRCLGGQPWLPDRPTGHAARQRSRQFRLADHHCRRYPPNGYRYEAIPDGIGRLPNGRGTLDVLVSHETSLLPGNSVSAHFIPVPRSIALGNQTPLENWSNANNVFQFIRVEDMAYDKNDPRGLPGRYR